MFSSNNYLDVERYPSAFHSLKHQVQQLAQWILTRIDVENPQIARQICSFIPAQCPFERDITFLGHQLFHIPALCHLNPAYDQLMELRFRALSYLADSCGEDVTPYCR